MLYRRESERLHRVTVAGGLVPSLSLLDDLIRFLNGTETESGRSVLRILLQMLEIEGMAKPLKGLLWPDLSLRKSDPEKFKQLCEIDDKVASLQRELATFKFVPRAEVAVGGGGSTSEWATWWGHANEKSEEGLRMRASEAMEVILKLTQIGSLGRLKQCANCGKWLYAKFRHQEYCSMLCQQKNYSQSEQWKAHRRQYMRNYYQANYRENRRKRQRKS